MLPRPPLSRLRLALRPAAAGLLLLAVAPVSAGAAVVVSLPAEQLHGSAKLVRTVRDAKAEGRRALLLRGATTVVATLDAGAPATRLTVRVRARRCHGAPTLRVGLDGRTILRRRIAARGYVLVTAKRTIAAGTHRLTLALSHPLRRGAGCRRGLYLDTVNALGPQAPDPSHTGGGAGPGGGATTPPLEPPPAAGSPPGTATTEPSPHAPTAAPPGLLGARLRWPAPALSAPTVIAVADGDQWYRLAAGKDYILDLPAVPHRGTLGFEGGRNVTILGGHIALPAGSTKDSALEIRSNGGTVHVEGLWIDGSSGYQADAVRISSPSSIVQLENLRVTGLRGSADGAHADVVQPYGGVKALRIDRLSGSTNYQGLFLRPDLGAIGSVDLSNVDLSYDDVGVRDGGYLLWLTTGCSTATTRLSNVYVKPSSGKRLATSVWPNVYDASCPAKPAGATISWPKLPVTGFVTGGTPPGGPFVGATAAGGAYVSPGYG